MSPPKPFGADTKNNIFSSFSLLSPIIGKLQGSEKSESLQLDIGAPEAGYSISVDGSKANVTFSYSIDNDLDSNNGRLILKDSFEVDLNNKTLLDFHRVIEGGNYGDFWSKAARRLGEAKDFTASNQEVRDFFSKVLLKLPLPDPEEKPEDPLLRVGESETKSERSDISWMFQLYTMPSLSDPQVIPRGAKLLNRRVQFQQATSLSSVQLMMDAQSKSFVSAASSPKMLAALFCGSLGFQLGRSLGTGFVFKSFGTSRLVSTGVGLLFEVPSFEISGRAMDAFETGKFQWDGLASSMFRNYLTFGAFRGANSISRSPIASFAALHGINELERYSGIQPTASPDYMQRVFQDSILFVQLSFATQMSATILGRTLGTHQALSERAYETEMGVLKEVQSWKQSAEVFIRRGVYQDGNYHFDATPKVAYLNPKKTSWVLGVPDVAEGFYPDVIAAHEESPPLQIFRDEDGSYFIQRHPDKPGQANLEIDYNDPTTSYWAPLGSEAVPIVPDMSIQAGRRSLYKIHLPANYKVPEDIPPQTIPPTPLLYLQELKAGSPILATVKGDDAGTVVRALKTHLFIPGFGEVSAFTAVGIDKHVLYNTRSIGLNEDAFGIFHDAAGNPVFIVCDGMGGLDAGDVASKIGVEHMGQRVMRDGNMSLADIALSAHADIQTNAQEGQTVMGALRIRPDGTVEHVSAGDIRFWVIRKMPGGSHKIFEPHLPDTLAAAFKKMGMPPQTTIELNAHPKSSEVLSGLGGKNRTLVVVDTLETGIEYQLFHQEKLQINVGTEANPKWEDLVLQEGDELVLMSDGVADLLDEEQFLALTTGAVHAREILGAVGLYTARALDLYTWRNGLQADLKDKIEIPSGHLYEGFFINFEGDIYKKGTAPDEWQMIAHVGPDNPTALVYRHNPRQTHISLSEDAPTAPKHSGSVSPPPPPLPIEVPVLQIIRGRSVEDIHSDSMKIVIGRKSHSQLFEADHTWIADEHFKIEYVKEKGVWLYKLTSLVEGGLSVKNMESGKKRIFIILGKDVSILLPPDSYELQFKKSESEFDDGFMMNLPSIKARSKT